MSLASFVVAPGPGTESAPRRIPPGIVVYAIGDIHGRADLLAEIHDGIRADAPARGKARRVAVYLDDDVSRARQDREVIDTLIMRRLPGFERVPANERLRWRLATLTAEGPDHGA